MIRTIDTLLTIVSQKRDTKIIAQRKQVHCVAEEVRDEVVCCDKWHENELQHIKEDPDWQECANRHLAVVRIYSSTMQHLHRSSNQTQEPLHHHLEVQTALVDACQGFFPQERTLTSIPIKTCLGSDRARRPVLLEWSFRSRLHMQDPTQGQ